MGTQRHSFTPETKRRGGGGKPWDPSKRGKCSWTRENSLGCLPGTQQRQVLSPSSHPAMPFWPRVPGPQAGGSNSTYFLSFSEAEVCDQGAVGLVSLSPLHLAYGWPPSCCLFAWCPVCLGASLNHKATSYSGIACTYCLTLT